MTLRYTDNDYLLPPPYRLDDMDVIGFWLVGKSSSIRKQIATHLNLRADTELKLLTDLIRQAFEQVLGTTIVSVFADAGDAPYPVLLTIHQIGRLTSDARLPDGTLLSSRGSFDYREAVFWIPVFEHRANATVVVNVSDGTLPPTLLYVPLIIADDPLSVAGGREVFGLPKRYGGIQIPAALNPHTRAIAPLHQVLIGEIIQLSTSVLPQYGVNAQGVVDSILDITFQSLPHQNTNTTPASWDEVLFKVVAEASGILGDILGITELLAEIDILSSPLLTRLINSIVNTYIEKVKVVALKQFRQGKTDYGLPSFMSVNHMTYEIDFEHGHLIDDLTIIVNPHDHDSLSLTDMLGIEQQEVKSAFQIKISGELRGEDEIRLVP